METDQHYFRVGMYIISLLFLLAVFAVWLADFTSSDDRLYRIYFRESVSGLTEGGPVKFRGVDVGKVETIEIDHEDPRRIKVDVRIKRNVPVKVNTVASLKLQGITGAVYVELAGGTRDAEKLVDATPDDVVPVIRSEESSIAAIMNQLPVIMEKLAHFSEQMEKLASDENIAHLNNFFANTSDISSSVKQDSKQMLRSLRKSARDINSVTERVKDDPSALIFPGEEKGIPAP